MWNFSQDGFISIVLSKDNPNELIIRSRFKPDLLRVHKLCHEAGPIREDVGTDYKFRFTTTKADYKQANGVMIDNIDYTNFKDRVDEIHGKERHDLYLRIWWEIKRYAAPFTHVFRGK